MTEPRTYGTAACPTCGKPYERRSGRHLYCTPACRRAAYGFAVCARPGCGQTFERHMHNQLYCSRACRDACSPTRLRDAAARRANKPPDPRLDSIAFMLDRGMNHRAIGEALGITKQRVAQLVQDGRARGLLPPAAPDPLDELLAKRDVSPDGVT